MQTGDTISFYSELKALRKIKNANVPQWEYNLFQIVTAMFDWKNIPIPEPYNIEVYLNLFGECAIWETPEGWAVTRCTRSGSPNVNGRGKDLICTTGNGISKTFNDFEQRDDIVYIKNDDLATPDVNIERVASFMGEVELSLTHLAINSRMTPIALARDDKEKIAIDGAMNVNGSEKTYAVLSSNIATLLENGQQNIPVVNLTDVDASDKIQYLHKSKDDTLRQFYNLYGMDVCGAGKMAQQSVAEINSGCNSHLIIPTARLKCRRDAVERLNTLFGWSVSVDFSECWKREEADKQQPEEVAEQPAEGAESEVENEESV